MMKESKDIPILSYNAQFEKWIKITFPPDFRVEHVPPSEKNYDQFLNSFINYLIEEKYFNSPMDSEPIEIFLSHDDPTYIRRLFILYLMIVDFVQDYSISAFIELAFMLNLPQYYSSYLTNCFILFNYTNSKLLSPNNTKKYVHETFFINSLLIPQAPIFTLRLVFHQLIEKGFFEESLKFYRFYNFVPKTREDRIDLMLCLCNNNLYLEALLTARKLSKVPATPEENTQDVLKPLIQTILETAMKKDLISEFSSLPLIDKEIELLDQIKCPISKHMQNIFYMKHCMFNKMNTDDNNSKLIQTLKDHHNS